MIAPSKTSPNHRLQEIFGASVHDVAFRLPDGTVWPDVGPRRATIVFRHEGALPALLAAGSEKELAEAFLRADFDVEGDLEAALEIVAPLRERKRDVWPTAFARALDWRHWPHAPVLRAWPRIVPAGALLHSRARDRRAVSFHYDVSNEFFALWLDPLMVYSCGYFHDPADDLELAQRAKLRRVCRKLRLRGGQRVLDLGCGWGGFARLAAREFRVHVDGITLSEAQAGWGATALADERLAHATIARADYRELVASGAYDAVVSIGMSEHVGREHLIGYFGKVARFLKPGGVCLNQCIGEGVRPRTTFGASFIDRYVFPDADIPGLPLVLRAAEVAGLEVRDVENLREHYTLTLREWRRRLEQRSAAALEFVDEPTYRTWRLYLAASARGFECGELAVYQVLLSRPDADGRSGLPLERVA